jgi:hypothetical protein
MLGELKPQGPKGSMPRRARVWLVVKVNGRRLGISQLSTFARACAAAPLRGGGAHSSECRPCALCSTFCARTGTRARHGGRMLQHYELRQPAPQGPRPGDWELGAQRVMGRRTGSTAQGLANSYRVQGVPS